MIDKLLSSTTRSSTTKNYLSIWRQFNKFVIDLDIRPDTWEDRVTLFIGYKIEQGMKSTTVKCYVSAIKKMLVEDGYGWDDQKVFLGSLTRACRLINDRVFTRLPIQCSLLEMILFEIQRVYDGQYYLELLYKALFVLAYYGLMRVGEVTQSDHVLQANHIHMGINKDKMLIILYSSKTHSTAMKPQKIRITSNFEEKSGFYARRNFCPFELVHQYLVARVQVWDEDVGQLFIFRDGSPVTPNHARSVLRNCLMNLGLDHTMYGMHSFRVGRTTDLIKYNYSLEEVKRMGRWRSNTVYKYIRM